MKQAAVSPYRDAIDHLPPGGMLVVPGVTWEAYETLLEELSDRPGVRVTYDEGRLQAVSPLSAHEQFSEVISDLALMAARWLGLRLEKRGSVTLMQPSRRRGVEADRCFYIANAHRIMGKIALDLAEDPPPDIAVEIDMSSDSRAKIPIYAGMGVPELWIYNGRRLRILELDEASGRYQDVTGSKFLPCFSVPVLERFLELSKTTGQDEVRDGFEAWLKTWKPQ